MDIYKRIVSLLNNQGLMTYQQKLGWWKIIGGRKRYKGKIHRRRLTVSGTDGQNFFAVAYESADGRWFDNCGMPVKKPVIISNDIEQENSSSNF